MPNPPPPHDLHFFMDGKRIENDKKHLTGAEIKAKAGVDPAFAIFEEGPGHSPDRAISDGDTVNLEGQTKHFFSVPPATFGRA